MTHRTGYLIYATFALSFAAFAAAQQQGTSQGAGGGRLARDQEDLGLSLDRWQPKRLPALPAGITLDMIRAGDSVYRGRGGCVTCHGPDAFGMANSGSGLTMGLNFIPSELAAIDSLVTAGIPEAVTRASVAMPPRGAGQNLTPEESRQVSAYVWAISRVYDEPWPGGHRTHRTDGQQPGAPGDTTRGAGGRTP
jgi:mono/diheme cytochrome c family protein